MKTILTVGICFFAVLYSTGCSSGKTTSTAPEGDAHNSMTSLDWAGTYHGILPCADCEGIETIVNLNKDLTFQSWRKYMGRQDSVYHSTGKFIWNQGGSTITLKDGESSITYKVGENKLIQLDGDGKPITGDIASRFVLTMEEPVITERYWKLTELMGKPVMGDFIREPHIILKAESGRFNGNGGCNSLNGAYTLSDNNRIAFSKIISTKMACAGMDIEQQFLKVLETADSYVLIEDTLVLNRARMAPLARFETVWLK